MLLKIDVAIGELDYLKMEIINIKYALEHPDEDCPLTEACRAALLIRLAVLDNGYKYLSRLIANDLSTLALTDIFTSKAKENE